MGRVKYDAPKNSRDGYALAIRELREKHLHPQIADIQSSTETEPAVLMIVNGGEPVYVTLTPRMIAKLSIQISHELAKLVEHG
ncbi:hypothetical protein UFOVP1672_35 [uncultured Caudovirales phage]|uniref:Uncharacterized protein n=1 Tax=uncultured Caudovirales phage TaxID=2100421 RepID=A0A6J5Q000_9CAUD|nr:hypothetical protein UFOVP988_57 [uncultured Caudovirales phage]CAB4210969.1 hypothetical protein UFOVP1425_57 [uncultured Caudovirales phage]CAB4223386.1 hypothetical protein UFOVP1672_35 [uncultured Caudovirales phage]